MNMGPHLNLGKGRALKFAAQAAFRAVSNEPIDVESIIGLVETKGSLFAGSVAKGSF